VSVAGCSEEDLALDGGPRSARVPAGATADRVERVTDGDTINLAGLGKVRLIGIDTPEVYGGVECYGREASEFTKSLLPPGRRVYYERGVEGTDRYGRALAYVWLHDGRFLNRVLVERGYAQPLTIPPNVDFEELFRRAARRARRASRGLWGVAGCG
jgi:micrococcal nuclease